MFKVTMLALGNKMPFWVEQAVLIFEKRLKEYVEFQLVEIPLIKRSKVSDQERILKKEKEQILSAIPKNTYLICLDVKGKSFSSDGMAQQLEKLQHITGHVCFLMGGPEGISQEVLKQSQEQWSLSSLTMPHTLARIVFVEALYRAYTIINNHPYHRS